MVNYTQLEPFTACSLFTVPGLTQAFLLPHTSAPPRQEGNETAEYTEGKLQGEKLVPQSCCNISLPLQQLTVQLLILTEKNILLPFMVQMRHGGSGSE